MNKFFILLAVIVNLQMAYAAPANSKSETAVVEGVDAVLEGAAWVTTDLDASINFYTKFLGYTLHKRVKFSSRAVLDTYGVKDDRELEYAGLGPANWSRETKMPGMNFIEIADAADSGLDQDAKREPIVSEVVMAFLVNNIEQVAAAMQAEDVTFITGLTPSATGKSITLTVLDPNGVRVQLYQYVKQAE